jgi:hypothetical protein
MCRVSWPYVTLVPQHILNHYQTLELYFAIVLKYTIPNLDANSHLVGKCSTYTHTCERRGGKGYLLIFVCRVEWRYVVLCPQHLPKHYQTLELCFSILFRVSIRVWLQTSTRRWKYMLFSALRKQGVYLILKWRAKWLYVVLFTHHLPKYYQTLEIYLSMVFKHSTWIWLQKSTWYRKSN